MDSGRWTDIERYSKCIVEINLDMKDEKSARVAASRLKNIQKTLNKEAESRSYYDGKGMGAKIYNIGNNLIIGFN